MFETPAVLVPYPPLATADLGACYEELLCVVIEACVVVVVDDYRFSCLEANPPAVDAVVGIETPPVSALLYER